MDFWAIMWVTFIGGPMDGQVSYLVYPSMEMCEAATATVSDTLDYDHAIACEESSVAVRSIRPKNRGNN